MVPVFENVGERSTYKKYRLVDLLSVANKIFEKLVNNRNVDHLEKCGLFSDFFVFRSSLEQPLIFSQLSKVSKTCISDEKEHKLQINEVSFITNTRYKSIKSWQLCYRVSIIQNSNKKQSMKCQKSNCGNTKVISHL